MLDAVPDATLIVGASGEIVFANARARAMFGRPAGEWMGIVVDDLVPEPSRGAHGGHRTRYLAEPSVRPMGAAADLRARRSDGSEFPVEISLSPLRLGNEVYTFAAVRDITDRRAAEAELERSRETLRRAEAVLAITDDRERIARDLHDTVIQQLYGEALHLQAAAATVENPQRTRERIDAAVDGIDSVIKELRMTVFRLQGASLAPGGLRGRLLNIVTDVSTALGFEPRLQFDGLLESIDDEIAGHLTAVLREALSNVARHADADRVRVVVEAGDHITLAVADNGVGVPSEILGGNGLTNMATRASELGGRFDVTPQPGGGTLLVWRVPSQRRIGTPAERVLVVDGSDELVELIDIALSGQREIIAIHDGASALRFLETTRVDLVIADSSITTSDNATLIESIRATPAIEHTPIIVMSGMGSTASTGPADAVLVKPFDLQRLSEMVSDLLVLPQR